VQRFTLPDAPSSNEAPTRARLPGRPAHRSTSTRRAGFPFRAPGLDAPPTVRLGRGPHRHPSLLLALQPALGTPEVIRPPLRVTGEIHLVRQHQCDAPEVKPKIVMAHLQDALGELGGAPIEIEQSERIALEHDPARSSRRK